MRSKEDARALHELARLCGIKTSYHDVTGRRRQASLDSLLAGLRALRVPLESVQHVRDLLRARHRLSWLRGIEPVVVVWDGQAGQVPIRVAVAHAQDSIWCHLSLESGETQHWKAHLGAHEALESAEVDGSRYLVKPVMLPGELPRGYHQLRLESHGQSYETMIIASPREAFARDPISRRLWGIFVPLYAVHSGRSWGGGDFTDLRAMMEWVSELGGGGVATLPLLAAFLDEPFEASPYSPVSRLFWNEFYLDVTRAPELTRCPRARALLESSSVQDEVTELRTLPVVDYRRQMAVKRRLLEALARCCLAEIPERRSDLERFVQSHPQVEDYARFRATVERRRASWSQWPAVLRDGSLREGDYDEEAKRYHLYIQWLAHEQLGEVAELARRASQSLYLDLPVGVHPEGYDVWRERDVFVADASGGSPPDLVFTRGQDWGFPPLHPDAMRETRYRYVIAYLRQHLQLASLLRIDHVMGLHRMFSIPKGLEPRDGFYIRYRSEELYAILTLESHRYRSVMVGENLGTVPPEVNPAMTRRRAGRDPPGLLGLPEREFGLAGARHARRLVGRARTAERSDDRSGTRKLAAKDALSARGVH